MGDILNLIWRAVVELFRSRASLEGGAPDAAPPAQKSPKRRVFSNFVRLVFAGLYQPVPGVVNALVIVEPATVLGWDGAGFRLFWRWKSRGRGGRPKMPPEIRQLIRDMSVAIHFGVFPKSMENSAFGIDVGQTSVAKYMARNRRPPSQVWKTFLRDHADGIASMTCLWFRRSHFGCRLPAHAARGDGGRIFAVV